MKTHRGPFPAAWPLATALAALLALPSFSASGKDLLYLDFNDTAALGKQPAPLPSGQVNGDVTPSRDFPGAADMGSVGNIQVSPFRSPKGAFSVEARFRLRSYAPGDTRFISDILNTATWDTGPTQGFVLRIGGGYLYSPLPQSAYKSRADYQAALDWYSDSERAFLSQCIGEFTMARQNDDRDWKEVVTNRCIELNVWTHLVGVWDGKDMRIYLNGWDATDGWRKLGEGIPPALDSVVTAYAGARTSVDYDTRHLDGILDYVRVVDSAMSPREINLRFRTSYVPEEQPRLCTGVIIPVSPDAGERVQKDSVFRFTVVANQDCARFAHRDYRPGDTVEAEFARDPGFSRVLLRMEVTDTAFRIDPSKLKGADALFAGDIFWRLRLKHVSGTAAAKAASADAGAADDTSAGEWSSPRPLILDLKGDAAALGPRTGAARVVYLRPDTGLFFPDAGDGREPALYSLRGKRLDLRFQRWDFGWRLSAGQSIPTGLALRYRAE